MDLPDGTVVPSFMGVRERGAEPLRSSFSNLALRNGEVKKIIYPDDKDSISARFIEYVIEVQHSDANGPGVSARYHGCLLSDLFGSVADTIEYTLRVDDGTITGEDGIGNGAKVTVLCINGDTNSALIIGGIRDAKGGVKDSKDSKVKDDKARGHHYFSRFNGTSVSVNNDGEFTLQFLGKTKIDGNIDTDAGAKESASPTTVAITKDGSLEMYTKNRNQALKINHGENKFTITADKLFDIQVAGAQVFDVKKEVDWTFGSTWTIAAKKDSIIDIQEGKLDIHAADKCYLKTAGVYIGAASESFPLFETYRKAQQSLNNTLSQTLTQASVAIISAATAMSVPITGPVAAGPLLQQAGTALVQAVAALKSFEAQAQTFISKYNKND